MQVKTSDSLHILGVTAIISLILLILGGWLTFLGMGEWYYDLNFPSFQPPAWVFTPVWIVVLSCLAIATWLVIIRLHDSPGFVALALTLYGAQCILNGVWSLLFFTVQRPDMAFWQILVLDIFLMAMIWGYTKVSKAAGLLLLPYFFWLSLSTAINFSIVQNNTFPL